MTTRIIKKQNVVIDGAVTITKNAGISGKSHTECLGGTEKISAKIIDKTADFLVIELDCPCGRKSFLKCQYTKNENTNTEKQ